MRRPVISAIEETESQISSKRLIGFAFQPNAIVSIQRKAMEANAVVVPYLLSQLVRVIYAL
jgi:hypothetical protein